MTVKELKEKLNEYPDNMDVYLYSTSEFPYGYNISPKDRWDDIQRLKRLDPNKKYAIIKIENDK